ncbi:MAG: vanadium-dependent haloperoxidase [Actinobacteria bacterium]|nr:vanadium-dependent haloperoxidase [Actinomycetota bacterium]
MARALALISIALSDAGVSAWDAKFTYWNPRPENGIRDLGLDPEWKPYLGTPRFPAYPSGSAGYAGSVEAVMSYLFPDNAAELKRRAEEQAMSRLYAGIHWRYDSASLDAGRKIGGLVVERAKADGADRS